MADSLQISMGSKKEIYDQLLPQIASLVQGEQNLIANLANVAAALKEAFGFLWVGFYLDDNDGLVLGPFQGPIACTRIPYGKGVCGSSFSNSETIIVPDVDKFPGHIACSSDSKSEIVIPILDSQGSAKMVLDIDSDTLNDFDEVDKSKLEELGKIIEKLL